MENIMMNEEFFEKVAAYIKKKTMLEGDAEDIKNVFCNTLEYIAKDLGERLGDGTEVTTTLPGYVTVKASEREGNFGMGITAEEELKKRIKNDAEKDILDDEDDE